MKYPYKSLNRRFNGKIKQIREESPIEISNLVNLTHSIMKLSISTTDFLQQEKNYLPFEVLYVVSEDDLKFIDQNIEQMNYLYGEQIIRFTVITPNLPRDSYAFMKNTKVVVRYDKQYFDKSQYRDVFSKFSKDRHLWLLQQYVKTKFVHSAENPVLIVDADTFLVKKIDFISTLTHTFLLNENDFHYPYNRHFERFAGLKAPLLNFVSHTQIQLPSIVRDIYGLDFESGWIRWLNSGYSKGENSPVSEYQTYGAYLSVTSPKSCFFLFPEHELTYKEDLEEKSILNYLRKCKSDLITFGNKKEINI